MSLPRLLVFFAVALFALIGSAAYLKKNKDDNVDPNLLADVYVENVDLSEATQMATNPASPSKMGPERHLPATPDVDRTDELFRLVDPQLPIVETITYKARVPWHKGNAWISDYASHFQTSRHFIARSLNGRPDYFKQDVRNGDRFNVFRSDIDLEFHLVIDIIRAKMWFYYHNATDGTRELIKTYHVGLGRPSSGSASGYLTPLGTYQLGDRIMIYAPGQMGNYRGETTEMIQVFGTRWIPFAKEIAGATEPARGFGIHGSPWEKDSVTGELLEARDSVGRYESDGCIRMNTEDIEELFAIIVTKPTYVHLVKDVTLAEVPGNEVLR